MMAMRSQQCQAGMKRPITRSRLRKSLRMKGLKCSISILKTTHLARIPKIPLIPLLLLVVWVPTLRQCAHTRVRRYRIHMELMQAPQAAWRHMPTTVTLAPSSHTLSPKGIRTVHNTLRPTTAVAHPRMASLPPQDRTIHPPSLRSRVIGEAPSLPAVATLLLHHNSTDKVVTLQGPIPRIRKAIIAMVADMRRVEVRDTSLVVLPPLPHISLSSIRPMGEALRQARWRGKQCRGVGGMFEAL